MWPRLFTTCRVDDDDDDNDGDGCGGGGGDDDDDDDDDDSSNVGVTWDLIRNTRYILSS